MKADENSSLVIRLSLVILFSCLLSLKFTVYLQVKALGDLIIGICLHEFTNNEREILINTARGRRVRY